MKNNENVFDDLSIKSYLRRNYPTYEKLLHYAETLTIQCAQEGVMRSTFADDAVESLRSLKDGAKTDDQEKNKNPLTLMLKEYEITRGLIVSQKASDARYRGIREAKRLIQEWWIKDKESNPKLMKKSMPSIYKERLGQLGIDVKEDQMLRYLYKKLGKS